MRYSLCMSQHYRFYFLLLIGFLSFISMAHAQREGIDPGLGSTRQDSLPADSEGVMPLDTPVPMAYVVINDLHNLHTFTDTFQWEDNKHFPLQWNEAHLGNYGSASRSLTPSLSKHIGFSTGWFQYDSYFLDVDSFRYYNQDVPVSKIKYSESGQENTYVDLEFGRSFAKGLNLTVAYQRINQIGRFAHQRQKNTSFGIGIWHDAPNGKYDAFYNYLSNAVVTEENGGISEPDSIGKPLNPDESIATFIQGGLTNHKHRSFMTRQIFHLVSDSSQFGFDVWMQARFSTGLYKYVDEEAIEAAEYYGSEYLVDQRGIRQYTFEAENQWNLGISLPWKSAHSIIDASFRYRSIALEQEPTKRNINELYLDVAGRFNWIEPLMLKGELSLGLGQADGSISFKADGNLRIGNFGHLLGYWSILARNPYMVESSLYINQQLVYNVSLRDPFTNEVGVTWDYRDQKLQAGIKWLVLDNFIYFDSNSFPLQIDESFSLRRFFVAKEFDFSWIGLKGSFTWQPEPREELAVPTLLYSVSLFGRLQIFDRKVTLIPGIDIYYHDRFIGTTYFPVNGRYHLTYEKDIPDYFKMDVGLGLQINFIKAFVRFEDFVGLFKDRVLYDADFYPHYNGYFRIGVAAEFFN